MNAANAVVVMATGHRPNTKTGMLSTQFDPNSFSETNFKLLVAYAMRVLKKIKPVEVISGMALGWDQAVAQAAVILGIPVLAAVPFPGQENPWPKERRDHYATLLKAATRVHYVSRVPVQGTTDSARKADASRKLHQRNEWMVKNTQAILALHDGTMYGGTYSCLEFAKNWTKAENVDPLPVTHCWSGWQVFLNQIGPALDDERKAKLDALVALPPPAPKAGNEFVDDDISDPLAFELDELDEEILLQMQEDAAAAEASHDLPF